MTEWELCVQISARCKQEERKIALSLLGMTKYLKSELFKMLTVITLQKEIPIYTSK